MGKPRHPYLEIFIFNDEYKVIVTFGSEKGLRDVLDNWHHDPQQAFSVDTRGLTFWTKGCNPIIWLPRYPKKPSEYGTLAHEACHAIENIFNKVNQPLGDEVFAHSVGAVVRYTLHHGKQLTKDIATWEDRQVNRSARSRHKATGDSIKA